MRPKYLLGEVHAADKAVAGEVNAEAAPLLAAPAKERAARRHRRRVKPSARHLANDAQASEN